MVHGSLSGAEVLIVERDEPIRKMIAVLLRRAGFRTRSIARIDDTPSLFERKHFDVVVADALQPLAARGPALLARTVLVTTMAPPLLQVEPGTVFAVLRKPFDIDELVEAVRGCSRASREKRPVDVGRLRRFVADAPDLRRVLAAPSESPRELLLRSEMRRTMGELSEALHDAAELEPSRARADTFLAASAVAADLAGRVTATLTRVDH